jgi:pimeloyl-ACP methyl ester carboxylesterase
VIRAARSWLLWAASAVAAATFVLGVVSWRLGSSLIAPANHRVSLPPALGLANVSIPGPGHLIAASWRDLGRDRPAVLLLHGVRGDRASMVPRARLLIDAGFSVLLIDQQAHGETPGDMITMGWRESADVRAARDWLRARIPGGKLAVIGVSLGGAAVLLGEQPAGFDAVVLEATYPRIGRAIENRIGMRAGALKYALAPLLVAQIEPRMNIAVRDLEPIRHIATLGAPVLVVGGSRDEHTTEAETRQLFAAAAAPKGLWIVAGAAHQDFSRFDSEGYRANVVEFLKVNLLR